MRENVHEVFFSIICAQALKKVRACLYLGNFFKELISNCAETCTVFFSLYVRTHREIACLLLILFFLVILHYYILLTS